MCRETGLLVLDMMRCAQFLLFCVSRIFRVKNENNSYLTKKKRGGGYSIKGKGRPTLPGSATDQPALAARSAVRTPLGDRGTEPAQTAAGLGCGGRGGLPGAGT